MFNQQKNKSVPENVKYLCQGCILKNIYKK